MKVYTDGAKGDYVIGLGWTVTSDGKTTSGSRWMEGDYTSMVTEYYALIEGIRFASYAGRDEIEVYSDCHPMLNKMRHEDENNDDWRSRREGCLWLLGKFDDYELNTIHREQNYTADRLAYEALEEGRAQR